MSKAFKHSLIILALLGLVLSSIAHANLSSHESSECVACSYQPNKDFKTSETNLVIASCFAISEQKIFQPTLTIEEFSVCPFQGRAPPR